MKQRREGLETPPAECPPVECGQSDGATGALQKRQGPTVWTKLWSRSDRTLRLSVRSVVAVSVQCRSVDQTLALKVTGRWRQCLVLLSDEAVSLESDRTLGLCPITSDRTRPVGVGTLL